MGNIKFTVYPLFFALLQILKLEPSLYHLQLGLFQAHPQMRQFVRQCIERSVQELLPPVVERSIKIGLTTCEQIVKKVIHQTSSCVEKLAVINSVKVFQFGPKQSSFQKASKYECAMFTLYLNSAPKILQLIEQSQAQCFKTRWARHMRGTRCTCFL